MTLFAKDSFTADALDTALFAVGAQRALKIIEGLPDVEAVIVDATTMSTSPPVCTRG